MGASASAAATGITIANRHTESPLASTLRLIAPLPPDMHAQVAPEMSATERELNILSSTSLTLIHAHSYSDRTCFINLSSTILRAASPAEGNPRGFGKP